MSKMNDNLNRFQDLRAADGQQTAAATTENDMINDIQTIEMSDWQVARFFGESWTDRVKYCHKRHQFLIFHENRWVLDEKEAVRRWIAYIAEEAYAAASAAQMKTTAKRLRTLMSSRKISSVLKLLSVCGSVARVATEFDANDRLLNCRDALIDLEAMTAADPDPSALCEKQTACGFDPDAECPRWIKFIDAITCGDTDLAKYLRRVAGLALSARVEQKIFILYGRGANGKTTFVETLMELLGNYAAMTPIITLTTTKHEGSVPNDLAALVNKRMVVASEGKENRWLDESAVKRLTGGDTIKARFLFHEWFEFKPKFSLFILTNHRPRIQGTDDGIWRRIELIPFNFKFTDRSEPPAKPLSEVMNEFRAEMPGILNWCLMGYADWTQNGLKTPKCVSEATDDYRNGEDVLRDFINTHLIEMQGAETAQSRIFSAYRFWCEKNNIKPPSSFKLRRMMEERGMRFISQRNRRYLSGWRLITDLLVDEGQPVDFKREIIG